MVKKMKQKTNELLFRNSIFAWIALAVAAVLLIPHFAMQLTNGVNWTQTDFVVMGSLLFGMASLFVLAARKAPRRHRTLVGMIFLAVFVYTWAELAVGIFTNLGS
jgi:hypothetical protein